MIKLVMVVSVVKLYHKNSLYIHSQFLLKKNPDRLCMMSGCCPIRNMVFSQVSTSKRSRSGYGHGSG